MNLSNQIKKSYSVWNEGQAQLFLMHSNHKGPPGCDPRKRGGKEDGRGMEKMHDVKTRNKAIERQMARGQGWIIHRRAVQKVESMIPLNSSKKKKKLKQRRLRTKSISQFSLKRFVLSQQFLGSHQPKQEKANED